MRLASKIAVATVTAAAAIAGSAATASAATSAPVPAPAAAAASCSWTAPLGTDTIGGGVKFWLSYNACSREARGAIDLSSVPVFTYYWVVWVYNENTGAEQEATPEESGNTYTSPVGDAGTESHVCVQQYYDGSTVAYGPKTCSGYY